VIGGGIGGFSAALCLHQQGIEVEVFEQADGIRELGVGINLLPHAVKELSELGLLERLDATGVRTKELIYCSRFGQRIWTEPRGLDAGYAWPQFSIHRGHLQGLLHQAAEERIGGESLHVSHRLVGFDQGADGVVAHFAGSSDRTGDVLIGADGIHSAVRAQFYPGEGPPRWNGHMLWRGAVEDKPFLSGRSMIIAGDLKEKVVLYPISRTTADRGRSLTNWAVWVKLSDTRSRDRRDVPGILRDPVYDRLATRDYHVLYLGDLDLAGDDIEANARRVLDCAYDWERLAITTDPLLPEWAIRLAPLPASLALGRARCS
jgi:5-methylphenazine-1-carboxylate 1-monooxygenase